MSAPELCAPLLDYQPAPLPLDEEARLAALRQLNVLDTAPAESFDTVSRLAAQALTVPILLVSLVDENRQWFKAKVGLEVAQTPRDVSFCAYAVYAREPLVIPDATRDTRFAGNPLVLGAPHIRAYLGVPLFTRQGQPIGTLCAIDRQPRDFGAEELATLRGFARIVEEFFHARELALHAAGVLAFAERARDSLQAEVALQTRKLQMSHDALQAVNAKLHNDSVTDYLTGLKNRRVFSEKSELAARAHAQFGTSYGLILLDLDNFKQINDRYGHDTGDEVLRKTGTILRAHQRPGSHDVAARLGGEEFALLCGEGIEPASLRRLAEGIRAQLAEVLVGYRQSSINFTGSLGVASATPQDRDWKALYARADFALYEAKSSGKNRVVFGRVHSPSATGRMRTLRLTT